MNSENELMLAFLLINRIKDDTNYYVPYKITYDYIKDCKAWKICVWYKTPKNMIGEKSFVLTERQLNAIRMYK